MMRALVPLPAFDPARGPFPGGERDVVNMDAVIRFIRREWRRCVTWMLASVCAGIAFIVLSPAYYTASSTILLEDRTLRPPAELVGVAIATDPAYSESQVQVLQSDEVLGRVVDQNRLGENEEFGKAGGGLRALVSYLASAFLGPRAQVTPRHTATVNIRRGLSIKRVSTSNVVEIEFTSRNPVSAVMIANAIGQTYIDTQLELKRQARADAASQLQDRLAELRKKAFPLDQRAPDALPRTAAAGDQAEGQFRELQNSAETYRILYNNFLQRGYTESVEDSSVPGARMITSAAAPAEQSWPRSRLILAAAVVCGLAGGIGHALLLQVTDRRLRSVEDVELSTSHAFVAGISKSNGQTSLTMEEPQKKGLQAVYARSEVGIYDLMGKIAAKLQAAMSHQTRSKKAAVKSQEASTSIIGVVAPTEGAGVSLIASHLARIIAESGQDDPCRCELAKADRCSGWFECRLSPSAGEHVHHHPIEPLYSRHSHATRDCPDLGIERVAVDCQRIGRTGSRLRLDRRRFPLHRADFGFRGQRKYHPCGNRCCGGWKHFIRMPSCHTADDSEVQSRCANPEQDSSTRQMGPRVGKTWSS